MRFSTCLNQQTANSGQPSCSHSEESATKPGTVRCLAKNSLRCDVPFMRLISAVLLFIIFLTSTLPIAHAATDELYFIHQDHLGSTTVVTDERGDVVQHQRNFPYGSPRLSDSVPVTERGYTFQIKDSVTSLFYYNARYYDPTLATFTSADTMNDHSNRFSYVAGNPVNAVDPTGHVIGPVREGSFWHNFTQGLVDTAQYLRADFQYMVSGGKGIGERAVAGVDILTLGQLHRATNSFNNYMAWCEETDQKAGFSNLKEKLQRASDPGWQITFLAEGIVSPLYSQVRANASQRANQLRSEIDDVMARNYPSDVTRPLSVSRHKNAADDIVEVLERNNVSVDIIPLEEIRGGGYAATGFNPRTMQQQVQLGASTLDDVAGQANSFLAPRMQLEYLLHETEHIAQRIETGYLSHSGDYLAQLLVKGYGANAYETGADAFASGLLNKYMAY